MVKKVIKKRKTTRKKKKPARRSPKKSRRNTIEHEEKKEDDSKELESVLIENFVGLQSVMTNLSIKFGALSNNISKLLQVFEEAAKSYAQNGNTDNKDLLRKLDSLLDQNKTIAKGLVLMETKMSNGVRMGQTFPPQTPPIQAPPIQAPPIQAPPIQPFNGAVRQRPKALPSI